jgi:hypothetical protein
MEVVPPKTKELRKELGRFFEKVEFAGDGDCWTWVGSRYGNGYGQFWLRGRKMCAHRAAWLLFIGALPERPEAELDHQCNNRACVNPDHLQILTHRANLLKNRKPRAKPAPQRRKRGRVLATHCRNGHEYSEANTFLYRLKTGRIVRRCRGCAVETQRRFRKRHPDANAAACRKWQAKRKQCPPST